MCKAEVSTGLAEKLGLTEEEFGKIKTILRREPNYTELGMFSAMWSEHCSYKNSKPVLKLFPTKGKQVIQGPGENAGVVDIGDGWGVAFKVESHNHPSAVEPYEASATGGGGCLRDIFTMGARPVGLLGSLRLGKIETERTKYLLKEIARGFTTYANIAGVPVVGGEIYFDESYEGNPLVNAMTVGIVKHNKILKAKASGIGNIVLIIGGATGRDGVEGASFASGAITEEAAKKTSAVAIGDPKMGRVLREACLELIDKDLIVGMQDMGAAGLVCSTCETAYKAGTGIEIDISLVPRKEKGMIPYEIMLSESQERMLAIVEKKNLAKVEKILKKWKVPSTVIGRVTGDGILRVKEKDKVAAEVPASALVEAPVYQREDRRPSYLDTAVKLDLAEIEEPDDYGEALLGILENPTVASKEWVFKQGDPKVAKNIYMGPGVSDAALIKVPGSKKAVGVTVDCNATYCYLDPFRGGAIAVAEAARNLVSTGVKPLAITDGLNFGNPKNPEIFWQVKQSVLGISEACRKLDTPVVSGNVSFNNESTYGAVDPTPVIGMVGVINNISKAVSLEFKTSGDIILLIGKNKEELGGSQYLITIHNIKKGAAPDLDLDLEKKVQETVLGLIDKGFIKSAHDCSEGGLAVALAECCISRKNKMLGAEISLDEEGMRKDALLFGESQSRFIISISPKNQKEVEKIIDKKGLLFTVLGRTGGKKMIINIGEEKIVDIGLNELNKSWRGSIARSLGRR